MKKKAAFAVLMSFFTLAACFLLLEGGLRLLVPSNPFDARLYLRPYVKKINHVNLRGVSQNNRFTTNRWGFRGANPPRDWNRHATIITIGGSTTQCHYLDDTRTWPAQLETMLRREQPTVWVGNGGIDGNSTRGHILFMDKVVRKLHPSLVIFLVGINDLGYSLENTGVAVNPFEQYHFKARYWALEHSRVLQLLFLWKQIIFQKAVVVTNIVHSNYVPQPLDRETPLPADLRDALPSLPVFDRNIETLIAMGREMRVPMLFLTQPMLYADTPYWRRILGVMYWVRSSNVRYSAATYRRMLDLFNSDLMEICARNNVPCIDLAHEMPSSNDVFYDIVHLNDEGARRVAAVIAGYIEKNHLLKR